MNYYRTVTFLPPTETLIDFPVLVRIQRDRMKDRILSPQGWDVRFELDGTELFFDLDWYDASSGSGAWWVRIPTLSASAPTTIKMRYGDAAITSDRSAPETVWADYDYVYHFSGSDPFRDVRGGKAATPSVAAEFSVVNEMPTGQALRVAPTERCTLCFAEYLNINIGSVSFISRATQQYEMKWESDYYSYGFSGYDLSYGVYGAGLTFNPTMTFPSFVCYSASFGEAGADLIFNGSALDCSASERRDWLRDDAPEIEFRPNCVSYLEELRISKSVKKNAAWLNYEQAQIVRHEEFTSYSAEFDSSDVPLSRFFPWIIQSPYSGVLN